MNVLDGLRYSKEHEWVKVDKGTACIGLTDYAQHNLGEIVYLELPEIGDDFSAGDVLCTVDSVKAASDVYTPVSGRVIKVNEELCDTPEKINEDPYNSWLAVLKIDDTSEADKLMDADEYREFCESEE